MVQIPGGGSNNNKKNEENNNNNKLHQNIIVSLQTLLQTYSI